MIPSLEQNKSFIFYTLIIIILPLFGFKFLVSLIGNVLLLLFLITLLIVLVLFISFYSVKSKVNTCYKCGTISLGTNATCTNCGSDLSIKIEKDFKESNKPSEETIEVEAEEIK